MKKIILCFVMLFCTVQCFAATAPETAPDVPATKPDAPSGTLPRAPISIFSTSTDWEGLTRLQLNEYSAKFIPNKNLIGRGLVLYYLDGFPCYGLGYGVRVWLGPNKQHDGTLHIACLYRPEQINFAWRNATRDADEAPSTGLLTCPVSGDREMVIDLNKCTRGKDWQDIR